MTEIALTGVEHGSLTLRGNEISVKVGYANQNDLVFYPENPRIYTIVGVASEAPSQEEIFAALKDMEHVKQLVQSIKTNGGLHDPIVVRGNLVLEGNSRLAAYRLLSEKDPVKWGRIKCKVLPRDIKDGLVFALLGEYHIIGKKDWAKYEQAGYLYRRNKIIGVPSHEIAKELGMTINAVNKLIHTYEFMKSANDTDLTHWSYYEEYLKIKNIKKLREDHTQLDSVFIKKVKTGKIPKASDVRDKLKVILSANIKTIKKFLSGEKDFAQSYEAAIVQGHSDGCYKALNKFRLWIVEQEREDELLVLSYEIKSKCVYEISKIHKRVEKLQERLQ